METAAHRLQKPKPLLEAESHCSTLERGVRNMLMFSRQVGFDSKWGFFNLRRTYVELALLVLLVILVAGYRTELISLIGYPGNPHRLFTSESACIFDSRGGWKFLANVFLRF
jgi:hypothetical protein